jgi:hypothetical protein
MKKFLLATALIAALTAPAKAEMTPKDFPASADAQRWSENVLTAHVGCSVFVNALRSFSEPVRIAEQDLFVNIDNAELFGKRFLKWSDDDLAAVLRVYRDCAKLERGPTKQSGSCGCCLKFVT